MADAAKTCSAPAGLADDCHNVAKALKHPAASPDSVKCTVLQCKLVDRRTANVKIYTEVDVPAWRLFDTLANPANLTRTSDDIEDAKSTLLEDNGTICKWHIDCQARWRFWKLSGSTVFKMFMLSDRDKGTIQSNLREPGFLRKYEGFWTVEALNSSRPGMGAIGTPLPPRTSTSTASPYASGSDDGMENDRPSACPRASITLELTMSPKLSPPFPLNQILKGQAKGQACKMIRDLVRATRDMQEGDGNARSPRMGVQQLSLNA